MMVAFNFQGSFAALIEAGIKRQTIRRPRKGLHHLAPLQLYVGQRTKACRKLLDTVCTSWEAITIYDEYVLVCGEEIDYAALRELAWRDGFPNPDAMFYFFSEHYELPVSGNIIRWSVETTESATAFGVRNLSFLVNEHAKWTIESVDLLVKGGLRLYKTPNGMTAGVKTWNFDAWVRDVQGLPGYLMDGIPVGWVPLEWRHGQAVPKRGE